ncbi:ABC transporter substrate-binding protein [Neobacillus cucumis]|uniref:ABC transporter substrate-binding protein n=1 Tax=Neobacillus cucumis TaxID=1740721 RepID=UPI002E1C8B6B|nr:ABC transporter substrate-binding protein [Neobacillus cucumis]
MKKSLILMLPLVFLIVFSGCSSTETVKSVKKKEPVTLKIAWWGEQPRHDSTEKVIKLFEKNNPNIKIEYEYSNWDDYWKRLAPLAAANQLPDIVQMDMLYLKSYSDNDLLENLTPYIKDKIIDTKSIDNKILSGGMIGNQLFGFPLGINAPVVIMDKNLVSKAGVPIPKENWTWRDFENVVSEIHKGGNIYGFNGMESTEVFFSYYLHTKGKNIYNTEGTSLGYNNDQLFIDYFDMQLRLLSQGALPSVNVMEQINSIEDEPLVNHQAAMTFNHSNQYYSYTQAAKRPLEILPPPGPGQDIGLMVKPSQLFSITKGSKHKKEAARFINFFINNIEANKMMKGERGVSVSSKVASEVKKELPEDQRKIFDYVMKIERSNNHIETAYPLGATEVVKTLQDISNQILFKKITPAEGAEKFRTQANNILSKNKKDS